MASSLAVIPWNAESNKAVAKIDENSRPEGGRWALFFKAIQSPTSGRTMDQVYTTLGKALEMQANRAAYAFGLGPQVVAQKIKIYFGKGEETIQRLELLATTVPPKLEKRCLKLMKYALPTESANVQHQAFKNIVHLVTSFPGLRLVFLRTKCLDTSPSLDTISQLWNHSGCPDEDWEFWKILAATCLSECTISTIVEGSSISDLTNCQHGGLSVIEQLMVQHDCSDSQYSSALSLRYLGGILGFSAFWQDMGETHCYVVNKLCSKLVKVFKDIGVDVLALGPIEESELPFDYEGVDLLATNLLTGVLNWFNKLDQDNWAKQPWYETFKEVVQLLYKPRAGELLPCSSVFAASHFEEIFLTVFQDAELKLVVDGDNETTHTPKNMPYQMKMRDNIQEMKMICTTQTLTKTLWPQVEVSCPCQMRIAVTPIWNRMMLTYLNQDRILDIVQTHLEMQICHIQGQLPSLGPTPQAHHHVL
ncbi:High osmolarity signaling protein SHO1 [Mycena sanguinolenta]|uniref:High osmolarity signaling protein SHO1 n=1 Tax=Mycena sanguinolenta TaxID=230812 RepID=A0A8H6Z4K1_9AGAR|nr:High osmolarity signaling protein SHO1 [Mycena sanguinolenta]